jgi:VanZ family protein
MRRRLFWLGPPLVLMGVIFYMGTDVAAADRTHSLLETLLRRCWPALLAHLTAGALGELNGAFRKTGHFLGYALLGLLDARALRGLREGLTPRDGALACAAATLWAAVDEFHQLFSPKRTSSVWDVALDALGAATGIFLYWLWMRRTARKN